MFLLISHSLHLTGALAVLVPVAMIALRLFLRTRRSQHTRH